MASKVSDPFVGGLAHNTFGFVRPQGADSGPLVQSKCVDVRCPSDRCLKGFDKATDQEINEFLTK